MATVVALLSVDGTFVVVAAVAERIQSNLSILKCFFFSNIQYTKLLS